MVQFLLNLMIAFLWTLLGDEDRFQLSTFLRGYLIGLIIVWLIHKSFGYKFYLYKILPFIKLIILFTYELITSSLVTSNYILFKPEEINPGVLQYKTELNRDWEITILAMLIILTPGSFILKISEDNSKLLIHTINQNENENNKLLNSIRVYEGLIKEVVYS